MMRIGLFTDSYHPASNGVVVVIDSLRRELEAAGHEVYVFAPDASIAPNAVKLGAKIRAKMPEKITNFIEAHASKSPKIMHDDPHVIRLPAIQGEIKFAFFAPPQLLQIIRDLKLDVIQFFTPDQLGLMAAYAARKTGAILVGQHSTDIYAFSKDYPAIVLGCFVGGFLETGAHKLSTQQRRKFAKIYLSPRRFESNEKWGQRLVAGYTAMLYSGCDGVVAVSRKSANQLDVFAERVDEKLNLRVIPTGVDALPRPKNFAKKLIDFREKFALADDDEIILNFGRMAEEKNLPLLISAFSIVAKDHPRAKLVFAGDYIFLDKLKSIARKSPFADRIVFVGRYERADLPVICATAKLFAFPSLSDTQALVLNEAAGQNLPIVMIDRGGVNDVFRDGENGFFAHNSARDFAKKCNAILADDNLRQRFAKKSGELATNFSEKNQTAELVKFYRELLRRPLK